MQTVHDFLTHHRTSCNRHAIPNLGRSHNRDVSAQPAIIANLDRIRPLGSALSLIDVGAMGGGVQMHIGAKEDAGAYGDFGAVKDGHVVVGVEPVPSAGFSMRTVA